MKLLRHEVGICNCLNTKTRIKYHDELCYYRLIKEKEASMKKSQYSEGLHGTWEIMINNNLNLVHSNFKHDMMLTLTGDFADDDLAMRYLDLIKNKLDTV